MRVTTDSQQLTPLQQLALAGGGGVPDPATVGGGLDPAIAAAVHAQPGPSTIAGGLDPAIATAAQAQPSPTTIAGGLDPAIAAGLGAHAAAAPPEAPSVSADQAAPGADTAAVTANPLEQDPAYQAQKAEDDRLLNQSASGYLTNAKNLLLGFGSQELAKSTLDELMKDPRIAAMFTPADEAAFLSSVSNNPDTSLSTQARLALSQRQQASQLDEGLNKSNLFYSGTRAQALGDQSHANQAASADARGKIQGSLQVIAQQYLAAQNAARAGDLAGFQAAYDRALQEAQTYGTGDPGTKDAATTPSADGVSPPTVRAVAPPKAPAAPRGRPAPRPQPRPDDRAGARGVTPPTPVKKKKPLVYQGRH